MGDKKEIAIFAKKGGAITKIGTKKFAGTMLLLILVAYTIFYISAMNTSQLADECREESSPATFGIKYKYVPFAVKTCIVLKTLDYAFDIYDPIVYGDRPFRVFFIPIYSCDSYEFPESSRLPFILTALGVGGMILGFWANNIFFDSIMLLIGVSIISKLQCGLYGVRIQLWDAAYKLTQMSLGWLNVRTQCCDNKDLWLFVIVAVVIGAIFVWEKYISPKWWREKVRNIVNRKVRNLRRKMFK